MARISVTLSPYEDEHSFGYSVKHSRKVDNPFDFKTVYQVRAKTPAVSRQQARNSFILEERFGDTQNKAWSSFDFTEDRERADKVMLSRARRNARLTLVGLMPIFYDLSKKEKGAKK